AFGERAAQDDLRARAPVAHLDAVAALEGLDQLVRVFGREGGVEEERSFLLRALEEALLAVRARVARELRQRLRLRGERNEKNRDCPHFHCALRLTITSSNAFCHLSCWSMAAAGSISLKRRCASGEGRLARVGT